MQFTLTFLLFVILTLFNQIAHCQRGCYVAEGGIWDIIGSPLKRFGVECALEGHGQSGVKNNREEATDTILNIDKVMRKCLREMNYAIQEQETEEREQDRSSFEQSQSKTTTPIDEKKRLEKTVEQYCRYTNDLLECFQPLKDVYQKCKSTEGLAFMKLAEEVCKQKGHKIIEFLRADGISCFDGVGGPPSSLIKPEAKSFQACLDQKFNSKYPNGDALESYIFKNTCKATSELKNCALPIINGCKKSGAKKIVDEFLNHLKKLSPETEKCFFHDEPQQTEQTFQKKPSGNGNKKVPSSGKYGKSKSGVKY